MNHPINLRMIREKKNAHTHKHTHELTHPNIWIMKHRNETKKQKTKTPNNKFCEKSENSSRVNDHERISFLKRTLFFYFLWSFKFASLEIIIREFEIFMLKLKFMKQKTTLASKKLRLGSVLTIWFFQKLYVAQLFRIIRFS